MARLKQWRRRVMPRVGVALMSSFSYLPMSFSQRFGRGVGWLLGRFPNKERRIARINIDICFPELSPARRDHLVKQALKESATLFIELGSVWRWPVDRLLKQIKVVHGEELLEKFRRGKVLALSPHVGNFELAAVYLSSITPMTVMYKPAKNPAFDTFQLEARSRFGHKLVPADGSGVRALFKAMKKGGNLAILPDQEPKSGAGVFAPFYGKAAHTLTLVSRLARDEEVSVIFCIGERLGPGKGFAIHLIEADRAALGDRDAVAAAAAMNRDIEKIIELAPEQYLWTYKRFQTQPEGEPAVYRQQ